MQPKTQSGTCILLGKPRLWVFFFSLNLECKENKRNLWLLNTPRHHHHHHFILSNSSPEWLFQISAGPLSFSFPVFASIHICKNIQPHGLWHAVSRDGGHSRLGREETPGPAGSWWAKGGGSQHQPLPQPAGVLMPDRSPPQAAEL